MSDSDTLLSMGFSDIKVARALKATKSSGLQSALDWLEAHQDDDDHAAEEDAEPRSSATPVDDVEPKSLRCMECGKVFKNHALASYHGEKSGHDQFEESTEEIKPLTEEEKAAKLAELKERMNLKKAANAKRDAEEFKANEAIRRKGGKDQAQIKADLALKEAEKEAAQRKKDKIDDARAKAAVKAQIEADKKARAEKAAREKALREGKAPPVTSDEQTSLPKSAAQAVSGNKTYDQTRLQIRLSNGGQPLVHAVPSAATLGDVIEWVKAQTSLPSVTLSSAFPRKTYGSADASKTMIELGLTPSAVLIVS